MLSDTSYRSQYVEILMSDLNDNVLLIILEIVKYANVIIIYVNRFLPH
jgi:hypothetical protein